MYLPNSSAIGRKRHKVSFLSRVNPVWIQFSFSKTGFLTKTKEPSMPYNLSIAEVWTDGFMPFLRTLMWSEM